MPFFFKAMRKSLATTCSPNLLLLLTLLILTFETIRFFQFHPTPLPPQPLTADLTSRDAHVRPCMHRRKKFPIPACSKRGRTKTFLLSFMGHSGSTAIMTELGTHPDVYLDVLEPIDHVKVVNTTWGLETARAIFDKGIAMNKTTGFKIRPKHVLKAPEAWRALMEEYETRIIWQYRKNLVKDAVGEIGFTKKSDPLAFVGGMQRSDENQCNKKNGCRFKIDDMEDLYDRLLRKTKIIGTIAESTAILTGGGSCVMEAPYEDYLYDREATLRDLQEFLGLDVRETHATRFKSTGDNLCEIVENWKEVCRNFYTCVSWSPMLDDAMNQCFCPVEAAARSEYCDIDFRRLSRK